MGLRRQAHRYAYELLVGPIASGLVLDHLCRNPGCVNPKHLEPVTDRENTRRGISSAAENAKKTHCYRGHPFDERNTYVNLKGKRACRECAKAYQKRLRDSRRVARVSVESQNY
jgi:hypothetical protein